MDVLVLYTIRPSCLRALDGDQSRGFGALRGHAGGEWVVIGWVPDVFSPVADRPPDPREPIHFDLNHSERLVAVPLPCREPSTFVTLTLRFLSARAAISCCAFPSEQSAES